MPILVLLVYSSKNWRSFVATKYLVLKTKIHEVCKNRKKEEENKSNTSASTTSSLRIKKNCEESEKILKTPTNMQYTVNIEEGQFRKLSMIK